MQLDVDEPVHSIFLREAPDETLLVLPNSLCWIAGDAVYSVPFRLLARMYTQG
jgi:hypothetical protein